MSTPTRVRSLPALGTHAGPATPPSGLRPSATPAAERRGRVWEPSQGSQEKQSRVRILGIDPGSLRLGYGVIDRIGRAQLSYVECGVLAAPARMELAERLVTIGRGLRELIDELHPDEVAMEQAFFGKNVQSTLVLGEARGMATFVVCDKGLGLAGYAPAKIKRTIVGHGAATKQQIGFLVRALLSLRRVPEPDAADALAIAICHARHRTLLGVDRKRDRSPRSCDDTAP